MSALFILLMAGTALFLALCAAGYVVLLELDRADQRSEDR